MFKRPVESMARDRSREDERYGERLRDVRRWLRREQTPAERFLWQRLRNRQLGGRKFRRQYSVGGFVLDFYCVEERLAIELDGSVHIDPLQREYDEERTRVLSSLGMRVIRFENWEVFERTELVLERITLHFGLVEKGLGRESTVSSKRGI